MRSCDTSALNWWKSSKSANNGACVEVAILPEGGITVRDSKNATGPTLVFTPTEWDAFIGGVKDGEFDV
jgi:hypothetical protein